MITESPVVEAKEIKSPMLLQTGAQPVDPKLRKESAASNSTFLNSNKNSSDMSPVPKSPISREESSRRNDSQNFANISNNFRGINLEEANMDANKLIMNKSKSQHVKDHHMENPFAESIAAKEPKKTFREVAVAKQETRLERVSE